MSYTTLLQKPTFITTAFKRFHHCFYFRFKSFGFMHNSLFIQCVKSTAKFGGLAIIWGPFKFGGLTTIWRGPCPSVEPPLINFCRKLVVAASDRV